MNSIRSEKSPIYLPLLVFASIVFLEILITLFMNHGKMTYTMDDPYIHLSLAENIWRGHYGINLTEYSAPASSIIWPFMLAPFSYLSFFEWIPLIFNIIFAALTMIYIWKILNFIWPNRDNKILAYFKSVMTIALMLSFNLIGLVFLGMEHSLQVFSVILIAFGIGIELKEHRFCPELLIGLGLAPLVRYENFAIVLPVMLYLLIRKHFKKLIIVSLLLGLTIGGFSLYLNSLGLDWIPTSINAKTNVIGDQNKVVQILKHFWGNMKMPNMKLLFLMVIGFASSALFIKKIHYKLLSIASIVAIIIHVFFGNFGWHNRYEVYIWSFSVMALIVIWGQNYGENFANWLNPRRLKRLSIIIFMSVGLLNFMYIFHHFTLPFYANQLYSHTYQMHRFAKYADEPIGINDIGYPSFRNDNYILDFAGLSYSDVLDLRVKYNDSSWLDSLAKEKGVKLLMVSEHWFTPLPDSWYKLGDLYSNNILEYIKATKPIQFYAIDSSEYPRLKKLLEDFKENKGKDFDFRFAENPLLKP